MTAPEIRYARNGDVAIAYGIVGDGPLDLVYIQGFVSDVELLWEHPDPARFLEALASFARLIVVDRRGVGLSDRFGEDQLPPLEDAVGDILAVLKAAGSYTASILGHHEGGQLAAMLAATHPEVVDRLILYSTPIAILEDVREVETTRMTIEQEVEEWRRSYGTRALDAELFEQLAPSRRGDADLARFLSRLHRHAASPSSAAGFLRLLLETNISGVLPSISAPTLVLHRVGDRTTPVAVGPRLAAAIPDARFVELEGDDWWPFVGDVDALVGEVRVFVTGSTRDVMRDRILATVLFTDIVGSTERAHELGDERWASLLEEHHRRIRSLLSEHQGREIDVAGDGFFAAFDGPARAIRCAGDAVAAVREIGLDIRAGVHTGECELVGERLRGIAVHVGARVGAAAGAGEVLVSAVVRDLSAGSGISFEDAGEHELKGVPEPVHLYRAVA